MSSMKITSALRSRQSSSRYTDRAAGEPGMVPAQHRVAGLERRRRGADLVEAGVTLAADHQRLAVGKVPVGHSTMVRPV